MLKSLEQPKIVEAEIVDPRMADVISPMSSDEALVHKELMLPSVPLSSAGATEMQECMRNIVQAAIREVPDIANGQVCAQVSIAMIPVVQLTLKKM